MKGVKAAERLILSCPIKGAGGVKIWVIDPVDDGDGAESEREFTQVLAGR